MGNESISFEDGKMVFKKFLNANLMEIENYSDLDFEENQHRKELIKDSDGNRKTVDKNKKYIIYTQAHLQGTPLTALEYHQNATKIYHYLFLIDEVEGIFYYNGKEVKQKEDSELFPKKVLIYLLLNKQGKLATYKEIFENVKEEETYSNSDDITVQKWISLLREILDDKLTWLLKASPKKGYRVLTKRGFQFCILGRLEHDSE